MSIKIYEVGGCVRDRLLGIASKDIDYAVEAPSFDAMRDYILAQQGKIYLEKPEYQTIRARLNTVDADFVLCRKDGYYSDGRRPDTVMPGSIYDDLARRDFTINAIAIDLETGKYLDPFKGVAAIENKLIDCVGNPFDRFSEDSLRVIRAIRFHITLGFDLSYQLRVAMTAPHIIEKLENISVDRIRDELCRCFRFDTIKTMQKLIRSYPDIAQAIFKEENKLWLDPTTKDKINE